MKTAIRNNRFKLVQLVAPNCNNQGESTTINEFYEINEAVPVPLLDRENQNLLAGGSLNVLTPQQRNNYNKLSRQLKNWSATVVGECPGDGNMDLIVNDLDVQGWSTFAQVNEGQSSWYDFNFDGVTDFLDLNIITDNFGKRCKPGKS